MIKTLLSILVVFSIAIGLSFAYADEWVMPFGSESLTSSWIDVRFEQNEDKSVNAWVVHTSQFHFPNEVSIPKKVYIYRETNEGGTSHAFVIELKEKFDLIFNPAVPVVVEEFQLPERVIEKMKNEQEAREKKAEDALHCILGIEGSSLFTEYRDRVVDDKLADFKHLPVDAQDRQIVKWTEECQHWKESYLENYIEYKNRFEAELKAQAEEAIRLEKLAPDYDSPYTDPVTEEELAEEAEEYNILPPGHRPVTGGFNGTGGSTSSQPEGRECGMVPNKETGKLESMCPIKLFNALIIQAYDEDANNIRIQQMVCDNYLLQYQNLVSRILAGEEDTALPAWLQHCELD